MTGDEAGGRDLFRRYFDQLYRFFANKCDEPEEMVQATFLAIVKARDQFSGRSQFRTYLFVVARNVLYRHLRTVRRERAFDPELSSIAELVSTAGAKLARNEDHRMLCAALRTLPVEQQTLLEPGQSRLWAQRVRKLRVHRSLRLGIREVCGLS